MPDMLGNMSQQELQSYRLSSLQDPSDGDGSETIADTLTAGDEADPAALAVLAEVEHAINDEDSGLFSSLERQVFSGLCAGKNYREIAEELGRSPKSVDNAVQRVRAKVRTLLV